MVLLTAYPHLTLLTKVLRKGNLPSDPPTKRGFDLGVGSYNAPIRG